MDIIRINNLQLLAIKKNELGNVEYFILNSNLDERNCHKGTPLIAGNLNLK